MPALFHWNARAAWNRKPGDERGENTERRRYPCHRRKGGIAGGKPKQFEFGRKIRGRIAKARRLRTAVKDGCISESGDPAECGNGKQSGHSRNCVVDAGLSSTDVMIAVDSGETTSAIPSPSTSIAGNIADQKP